LARSECRIRGSTPYRLSHDGWLCHSGTDWGSTDRWSTDRWSTDRWHSGARRQSVRSGIARIRRVVWVRLAILRTSASSKRADHSESKQQYAISQGMALYRPWVACHPGFKQWLLSSHRCSSSHGWDSHSAGHFRLFDLRINSGIFVISSS
jgi:hypothetical protein